MAITQASGPESTALTLSLTENNKTFHGWFTKHTIQALAVKPFKGWADCKLPFVHLGSFTWCKTKQMHKMVLDIPLEGIKQVRCWASSKKGLQLYCAVSCTISFSVSWEETMSNLILFPSPKKTGYYPYSVFFSHNFLFGVLFQIRRSTEK